MSVRKAPSPRGRALLRVVLVASAAVGLLLTGSAPAWAHASLLGTDPADGTLLATAPSTITLTFDEQVHADDGGVRLLDAGGAELPCTVQVVDNRVVITPRSLGTGTVVVSWQVISADSHPVSGGFTFAVGERTAGTVAAPAAEQDMWLRIAAAAGQALAYLGVLAACGLVGFDVLVLRGRGDDRVRARIRRISAWCAGAGLVGALLLLPLTELEQRFETLSGLLDMQTWTAQLSQDAGLTLVLVGAGVLLAWEAAWAVDQRTRAGAGAALAGCGLALGAFAVVGHTRAYGPVALVLTADLLHLTVAAFWLGGLIGLGLLLRATGRTIAGRGTAGATSGPAGHGTTATATRSPARRGLDATTVALTRFSTQAAVLVTILAVTGGLMAWRILGSWEALVATGYGQALLVKLALVVSAVALAAYNRYLVLPLVVGADAADAAWPRLRRTITIEAGLLIAVLAVTGWLVNASPGPDSGPNAPSAAGNAIDQRAALGSDTVTARITPGTVGINSLEFSVTDAAGQPVQPVSDPQVSVTMPAAGVGPLTRPVSAIGPGAYQSVLDLPLSGQWVVTISVRTSEFEQPGASIQVNLP